MDFCTTPTSLSLQDLITAPAKAESLLELLTPDQILAIEKTLGKVKKRRLDKEEIVIKTATKIVTPPIMKPTNNTNNNNTPSEPVTEVKDGVEWVSFVYSHNRTLKRYSIRTDLLQVDTSLIDDKFKSENCVCIHVIKKNKIFTIINIIIIGLSSSQFTQRRISW